MSGRQRVVVLSRQGERSLADTDRARLAALAEVDYHVLDDAPSAADAARMLEGAVVVAATNKCLPALDADLLDRLPALRCVVLYATGHDHVDTTLLASRGVALSVLPEYATGAVAEHAIAMLFGLATRLHLAHDRSRGLVDCDTSLRGVELAGRVLGVVGVGRIGGRVAELAAALGMRVVGNDIDPAAVVRAAEAGVAMTDLAGLLEVADAVAVCASHTFGAPALLRAEELHRMRRGALLVNVSRAALVDSAAAAAAVRAGRLRGYAVDDAVYSPATDGDLLGEGRILQTGHSAWWRDEVLERGRRMWGEHIVAAVLGRPMDVVTGVVPSPSAALPVPDQRRAVVRTPA